MDRQWLSSQALPSKIQSEYRSYKWHSLDELLFREQKLQYKSSLTGIRSNALAFIRTLNKTRLLKQILRGTRPRTRPHSEDETEVEVRKMIFPRSRTRRGEDFFVIPRLFRGRGETLEKLCQIVLFFKNSNFINHAAGSL